MNINFNSINREVEKVIIRHESEMLIDKIREETKGMTWIAALAMAARYMAGFLAESRARLEHAGKKFRFAKTSGNPREIKICGPIDE
jgi:hypothetical protein